MAVPNIIYHGNDNVFELKGLKDKAGNFMNAAVVTAKILDLQGVEVIASGYSAQTIPFVVASNGDYLKNVDKGVTDNIPAGHYQVEWTAEQGGADFKFKEYVPVTTRR